MQLRRSAHLATLAGITLAWTGAPPLAVAAEDSFLAQLAGPWQLVGTVRGKPVTARGEGRWVLKDAWLCFTLIDRARPGYRAQIYLGFDPRAGDYVVHWLDQFGAAGARVAGSGKREGQQLVLQIPYAEGAFRDTLTLSADARSGTLLLESQQQDGHWSTFASYRMQRLAASAPAIARP